MKNRYPKNQKPASKGRRPSPYAHEVDLFRGMNSWNGDVILAIIYHDGSPCQVFTASRGEWDFTWCPAECQLVYHNAGNGGPYFHRYVKGTSGVQVWIRRGCRVSFESSKCSTRPNNPWAARHGGRWITRTAPDGMLWHFGFPRPVKRMKRPTRRKLASYGLKQLAAPLVVDGSANPFKTDNSISDESGEAVYCEACGFHRFSDNFQTLPCGHLTCNEETDEWEPTTTITKDETETN